jgi:hypothetical protein
MSAKPEGPGGAPGGFRRTENPEDLRLSTAGEAFLASLDETVRPAQLAVRYPRIVNKMAQLWRQPRQMDRYLDELLMDTRGKRQGFPLQVLGELVALKEHYLTVAFPRRTDVWDGHTDGERNR